MRANTDLETRLVEWGDEFRQTKNSRYENLGYPSTSTLYKAMVYQGPAPQGLNPRGIETNTPADEVETAVRFLERQDEGYRPARVLRAEYAMSHAPEHEKLHSLKAIGLPMSRHTYYRALLLAKVHVAASLGLAFSPESDERACVAT